MSYFLSQGLSIVQHNGHLRVEIVGTVCVWKSVGWEGVEGGARNSENEHVR